jgi:predicted RNA-binding Zn-ribbon protein involved in translation (DUF1610 family)
MVTEKTKKPDESFCASCGEVIKTMAELCPKCGVRQRGSSQESSSMPMLLNVLIGLLGFLGVGHLVNGRTQTGILFMAGGLAAVFLFWVTIWVGIGLIFIPVYLGLWIWSIVNVKKTT